MSVERINQLVEQLNVHAYEYYVDDSPSISDAAYDALFNELKGLEAQFPNAVRPDSPTQRVGDKVSGDFENILHAVPMLSLDNAFNVGDMAKAFKTMTSVYKGVFAELKADGLAITLRYEDGLLVQATTRGDGTTGENVLHTVKTIQSIPLRLKTDNPPKVFEPRGEVVMPRKAFARYNEQAEKNGTKPLANPRNGAAGAIRNLDPKKAADRNLSFQAYALGEASNDFLMPQSQKELLDLFMDWGFEVSEYTASCHSVEDCEKVFEEVIQKRDAFSIDIDGIVFKTNNLEARQHIGSTSRAPKWAVAWKLPPEIQETKLLDVKYQTGRTGAISPIAVLTPVYVGGVTVSSTTLHNEEHLVEKLKLRHGDTVRIYRAGDVVPATHSRVDLPEQANATPYVFTTSCPSCGGAIEKRDAVWYCIDTANCPAQLTNGITRATGRDCLNIDGFGSALAEELTDNGMISNVADIFTLSQHRDALMALEGYGEKSVDKLLSAIEKAKQVPLDRFIYLMGITEVGRSLSRVLANKYRSIDALMAATFADLMETDDIGLITAKNIVDFFAKPESQALVNNLLAVGVNIIAPAEAKASVGGADYTGKTFVVTGTFSGIQRKEIEGHIKDHGGKVSGSPSAKTFATIVGDKAGSKLQKSQELGLTIITDADIVEACGDDIDKLPSLLMSIGVEAAA